MNRCLRCKREIKNIRARYGPVCAKIVGADEEYYKPNNSREKAFISGIMMAQKNLSNPAINSDKINVEAYGSAMGRYMVAVDGGKFAEAIKELQTAKDILNDKNILSLENKTTPKNSSKGRDTTEFGKGSYAYYHISTLEKMYANETNPAKKEKILSQIKDTETYYRNKISDTVLTGIPDVFFDKDNIQGIWTSPVDALQRFAGYANIYDSVFDLVTDINKVNTEFSYNGDTYRLEFWKAHYTVPLLDKIPSSGIDMGMGAEIGFYCKDNSSYIDRNVQGSFEVVKKDDYLTMSFSLYDRSNPKSDNDHGSLIFSRYPQEHWWLTGFKPDAPKIKANELRMVGEITFKDKAMKNAFVKAFNGMSEKKKQGMYIRESKLDPAKIYFDWKTN